MSKYAVKTLYPDGVESPYRAVALPMFASLCLTVGALLVLAAFLPDMDMPFVQGLREDAKQQVHELRYGEETQPDGELAKAAMLHSDNHVMLYVKSGQEKTLYLRGYTAGVYEDGAWVPLHGMAYTGDYSVMMRWLRNNGFDPARQPAQYLSLCADSGAESNDVTVEAL